MINVTEVKIDPAIAIHIAEMIISETCTEYREMSDDNTICEYAGEINSTFKYGTNFGLIEIDVSGTLREDYINEKLHYRWINDMILYCWLDGEEIGFNSEDLAIVIEKNVKK